LSWVTLNACYSIPRARKNVPHRAMALSGGSSDASKIINLAAY
jgi:hypothetical protein